MGLRAAYFTAYNTALALGWGYVFAKSVEVAIKEGPQAVYQAVELPLQISQTAAVMEILHSIFGIVRSPVAATLPQVLSRLFLVWGILWPVPQVREHWMVLSLVLSWSITEIFRYTFFAVKEASGGNAPAILLWLRYSLFYVLYPTGIASELGLTYLALPYIKASKIFYIDMPNKVNFAFDYYVCCVLVMLVYVPAGPHMYMHMMGQRRKALSPPKQKAV